MFDKAIRVVRFVSGGLFALTALGATGTAIAEDAPRSWVASPGIYRVLTFNDQFRLIKMTTKPGQRDKFHSHKTYATYFLTSCDLRLTMPDGTSRDIRGIPMGWSGITPPIKSHSSENIGKSDCEILLFELN